MQLILLWAALLHATNKQHTFCWHILAARHLAGHGEYKQIRCNPWFQVSIRERNMTAERWESWGLYKTGSRFQERFYNTGDIWVCSEKNGCETVTHMKTYVPKKKSGGLSSDKFLSRATCKSQKMLQRVQKKRIWILFFLFSYLFGCAGLNCSMWDLVPWPGTKPRPPAVGAQSLSHWTTREVLRIWILNFHSLSCQTTLCSRTAGKTGSSLLERLDWHSLGFQREAVTQHANARGQCDFTKDHRKCSRSCFG